MTLALVLAAALGQAAPVLSLDDTLRQASERNLDLEAARHRLAAARTASAKAWSGYLPHLSVGGSYTRNSVEARIGVPTGYFVRDVGAPQGPPFDPGQPASSQNPPGVATPYLLYPSGFQEAVIQARDQWGAQAELRQALVAPPLWVAMKSAALAEKVAELQSDAVRTEVLFAAAQLHFAAAGLKETVSVQKRLLAIRKDHASDAKVKYEAGAVGRMDFLRAQIELARAEQELARTQKAHAAAIGSLATLLDRAPDFEVELPKASPMAPDDASQLETQALLGRPDVNASRAAVELAGSSKLSVWASYLPSLGLSARYQVANVSGFTGQPDSWAASVGLSWTLWDGGLREAQLREAAAKLAEADASRRSLEAKVKDEVRRALLELATAKANQEKSAAQLSFARENVELVRAAYEAGAATSLEVNDAAGALLGAELSHLSESLNEKLASLSVLKAIGAFDAP